MTAANNLNPSGGQMLARYGLSQLPNLGESLDQTCPNGSEQPTDQERHGGP
jgi:hypothetical protein